MLYVRDWPSLYENSSSRRYNKLSNVLLPNAFDGSKYAELITSERGVEKYAAWVAILAIASHGAYGERGYIRRSDGSAHTPRTLALITRFPQEVFEIAIPHLLSLHWLVELNEEGSGGADVKPELQPRHTAEGEVPAEML